MESLEDATSSSHSTRRSGAKKITGVIGVIVVALGFIFFGTRAEPTVATLTPPGTAGAAGGASGLQLKLAVFDQTARWIDPASFRRRVRDASASRHRVEQCRLPQRPDM